MPRSVAYADNVMRSIIDTYFAPNRTVADLRELVKTGAGRARGTAGFRPRLGFTCRSGFPRAGTAIPWRPLCGGCRIPATEREQKAWRTRRSKPPHLFDGGRMTMLSSSIG